MIWSGRPVGWAIGGQILIKIMYICHKSTEIQYMLSQHCNLSHSAHVVNVTHLSLKYISDSPQPLFL